MILIADSGATKTEWRMIKNAEEISQALTDGISPQYEGENEIAEKLKLPVEKKVLPAEVEAIYFYGAGCSSEQKKAIVKNALLSVITTGKVEIFPDVTGVARSLCGKERGMACILGTGSSSCYYDGIKTEVRVPALGYILGDEGSGAHLGKLFLAAIFRKELSENVVDDFKSNYQLDLEKVLSSLNEEHYPSRYLASFAHFIHKHKNDKEIYQMIYKAFSVYCDKYILAYEEHRSCPTHFCGSIAFHFSDILSRVCKEKEIRTGNISKTPIAGLTLYHLAG